MAEYKDADAILKEIYHRANLSSLGEISTPHLDWKEVVSIINEQPTADVVEVVRCKNCKRAVPLIFQGYYKCRRHSACRKADDFCSYGERKDA